MHFQEKSLKLRDGTILHLRVSERSCNNWIIHTHGIGEHLERHNYISDLFSHNFNILQYDLRGHGKSSGKRAYVDSFFDYMKDLSEVISYLRKTYKMSSYVLMGHSMGALITAGYLQSYADDSFYPKLIHLNAPPVCAGGPVEFITKFLPQKVFHTLASLPYGVNVSGLLNINRLSHDPKVKQKYLDDPLTCTSANTKLLLGLVSASKEVFSRPIRPKCPAYISIGTKDTIVSYSECVHYFTLIEKAFRLKIFQGAYHEIHNEVKRYQSDYYEYLKTTIESCLWEKSA